MTASERLNKVLKLLDEAIQENRETIGGDQLTNGGRVRCHALMRQLEAAKQTASDALVGCTE